MGWAYPQGARRCAIIACCHIFIGRMGLAEEDRVTSEQLIERIHTMEAELGQCKWADGELAITYRDFGNWLF